MQPPKTVASATIPNQNPPWPSASPVPRGPEPNTGTKRSSSDGDEDGRRLCPTRVGPLRALNTKGRGRCSDTPAPALRNSPPSLFEPVVRSLLRDNHVVYVRLFEARGAYAYEARVLLELLYVAAARVAHARAEAADELGDHVRERALVRDAALDAFGDELRLHLGRLLRVAILRALAHRADGAHAAVRLERAPLVENQLARRLFGAREERAYHHHVRARRNRLRNVARELHAAVRDDGHARALRRLHAVVDGRHLRDARARHHTRRANRAGADAAFDRVHARAD